VIVEKIERHGFSPLEKSVFISIVFTKSTASGTYSTPDSDGVLYSEAGTCYVSGRSRQCTIYVELTVSSPVYPGMWLMRHQSPCRM
jgi:hypothetical protein